MLHTVFQPSLIHWPSDFLTYKAVAFQFAKVGNDIGAENLLEAIDNHKVIGDYVDRLPGKLRFTIFWDIY